jgi:hypothetical protein
MKNDVNPFVAAYAQWLDSFRAMLPGWPPLPKEPPCGQAQVAANQEWEDEGGSIQSTDTTTPGSVPAPKIPF